MDQLLTKLKVTKKNNQSAKNLKRKESTHRYLSHKNNDDKQPRKNRRLEKSKSEKANNGTQKVHTCKKTKRKAILKQVIMA